MNNIITYAEENRMSFSRREFCPVDSLILSWFTYLRWPADLLEIYTWKGIRLQELFRAECFDVIFEGIWDELSSHRLFTAMAASPRFRDIVVMGYAQQLDVDKEKQFAAISFRLSPGLYYIAFRGTDSTLVGWKEDFNMAFQYPVPSQVEAEKYLAEAASHCFGRLIVGGHSKGGNLAVYSAANCSASIRNRIERIYSHDGPGFLGEVLKSPQFSRISDKIDKTLPQSSLIGMLLEQQEQFRIIKSNKISFWQHDPFSWVVDGDDFYMIRQLTADARFLDLTLNEWILSLSRQQRERFVDVLYGILESNDIETWSDLRTDLVKNVPAIARTFSRLDGDTRYFLIKAVKGLAALGIRNFPELFRRR